MEDCRRRATSLRQIELMIQYMENHRDLALGRVRSKEARAHAGRLWEECALLLNAEGVTRTPKEWSRFWNDYKCRVRSKMADKNRQHNRTGGGPNIHIYFSPLEDRVASLIRRDVGSLPGVCRDPVMEDNTEEVHVTVEDAEVLPNNVLSLTLAEMPSIIHDATIDENVLQQSPERSRPIASQGDILAETVNISRNRKRRRSRAHSRSNNTEELNNARATIARIEEMQARTEEMSAAANLKHAEAALKQGEAISNIAKSFQTIAESIQKYLAHMTELNSHH